MVEITDLLTDSDVSVGSKGKAPRVAAALALGIFGSIDMNRNDYQSGWDTDQFPNNTPEVMLAYYEILKAGGFTTGGTNFDAKLRRQSLDPEDLILAHVGGMDTCARALKSAAAMLEDGRLEALTEFARRKFVEGGLPAERISVKPNFIDPAPPPGRGSVGGPVFVGRLRRDISHPRGIDMWVVADNIRKGAALNAVQIMDRLETIRS